MNVVLILLLILIGTFFAFKQKNICNLLTFNFYYWAFIISLASLKLFDMMNYSNKVFLIVALGLFGVLLGYVFGYYVLRMKKKNKNEIRYEYNDNIIGFLSIINIVFYLLEGIRVIQLLNNGTSYYFIRRMYQGYEETTFFISKFEQYFSSYIAIPIAYILSIYIIISLFKKEKKITTILLSTVATILYILVSANRIILILMLISAIYMMFLLKKKIPPKVKKIIKRISIVMVISILSVTLLKENKVNGHYYDWGLVRSFYSYFAIPIPLLDYWTNYIQYNNFQSYGVAFFRAPLNIINLLFLKPLNLTDFSILNETIKHINETDQFIMVFKKHSYNSFATMFYYFYMDFRMLGVFLGGIIWGIVSGKCFYNAITKNDEKNYAILLLCIYCLIKSMVRWEFSSPSFFVALIIIHFVFKKEKKVDE